MGYDVKDKLVLVTGASSGIGHALAIEFASKGAHLALTGRNVEALEKVQQTIEHAGGTAKIFPFDLLETSQIPELIKTIEQAFQTFPDVLVNCAGMAISGKVEDVPLEAFIFNLNINFIAPLALIQAVIPGMKQKQSGQIINLFSGAGKRGLPGLASYCASKFALNGLSESLRVELASYHIDVILFSPGLVNTPFHEHSQFYGEHPSQYTEGYTSTAEEVAKKLVQASYHQKRSVIMSPKTWVGVHLNYWTPKLLDLILKRKMLSETLKKQVPKKEE